MEARNATGKNWTARHTVLATAGLTLVFVAIAFVMYLVVYR